MAEREAEVTVSVAVVGDTASGKTQLINRFSRDTFSKVMILKYFVRRNNNFVWITCEAQQQ